MRYLADLLTLARFVLSIILIILSFISCPAENAFIIFLVAEFTDTFDGVCFPAAVFADEQDGIFGDIMLESFDIGPLKRFAKCMAVTFRAHPVFFQ